MVGPSLESHKILWSPRELFPAGTVSITHGFVSSVHNCDLQMTSYIAHIFCASVSFSNPIWRFLETGTLSCFPGHPQCLEQFLACDTFGKHVQMNPCGVLCSLESSLRGTKHRAWWGGLVHKSASPTALIHFLQTHEKMSDVVGCGCHPRPPTGRWESEADHLLDSC